MRKKIFNVTLAGMAAVTSYKVATPLIKTKREMEYIRDDVNPFIYRALLNTNIGMTIGEQVMLAYKRAEDPFVDKITLNEGPEVLRLLPVIIMKLMFNGLARTDIGKRIALTYDRVTGPDDGDQERYDEYRSPLARRLTKELEEASKLQNKTEPRRATDVPDRSTKASMGNDDNNKAPREYSTLKKGPASRVAAAATDTAHATTTQQKAPEKGRQQG